MIHSFWTALMFLTRIPAPYNPPWHQDSLVKASHFFPIIGLIVGTLCGAAFYLGAHFWNPMVGAALALLCGALITGAMHEDGLADTCDGLWGGMSPEKRREILKDSRMGAYGSLSMVLAALLKFAALSSLSPKDGFIALVLAHSFGRALPTLLMATLPYGGNPDRAKSSYTQGVPWGPALSNLSILISLTTLVVICLHLEFVWIWLALILIWQGSRILFVRKIQGYTGDTLGASEQAMEIAVLLLWGLL